MTNIDIRRAETSDYQAISQLVTSREELFLVFPNGSYPFTVKQVRYLAEQREDLTVVTADTAVIGFANLYDVAAGNWAFVGNVILNQQYRGKGIGERLVQHMLDKVFNWHHLPQARISVFEDNTPALSLYSKLGFKVYAREQRCKPDGQRVTLLHMLLEKP